MNNNYINKNGKDTDQSVNAIPDGIKYSPTQNEMASELADLLATYEYDRYVESSSDRLKEFGPNCGLSEHVIQNFDPASISWVTDRIGITAEDGVAQALHEGYFVINVAREISNDAQVKQPVQYGSGRVVHNLIGISNILDNVLKTTDQKVVVHCAMGMERSVLTVVWYMATKLGLTLDQALKQVKKARPIALNRLTWILG
tara:strand:+ start:815 stop:1417 length:603 start_codon:yes stop_codon:yes gene_type:complete